MRKLYNEVVEIPESISCEFVDGILRCTKGNVILEKKILLIGTDIKVDGKEIKFLCKKANKKSITQIRACAAHIRNMFNGFEEAYAYELEICNVHFPITAKVADNKVTITNFLGEKSPRNAEIVQGVNVEIKGNKITVSSHDIEKAGQTAANIERATKVKKRDRRVFQDGIFITSKPGRKE